MSSGDDSPDTGYAEANEGGWQRWFLLTGHRLHVTGLTALGLFAFLSVVTVSRVAPLRNVQPLYYVFGGLISGNLTVITVVVSISQLLLSRELGTPSELRSQIEGVTDYRNDIEEISGRIAPVEPLGFLRLVIETMRQHAQALAGLTISKTDEEVHDEISPVVSELTEQADRKDVLLQESDASTFQVLATTLTTNYARQINELRRIESEYNDRLTGDVEDSMDRLIHVIHDIDIARQYFKSIYLQQELAKLSRLLFYVGLASLAAVTAGILLFTASRGASVPRPYVTVVVAGTITAGLAPISLLFAFVLRIATVTQRTAATLPFTTPQQEK